MSGSSRSLDSARPAEASPDISAGEWRIVLWLTLLAIVVRSIGLNDGLWWDEMRTLIDSVRSPMYAIVTIYPGDNQHTLFSVLARLAVISFGEDVWTLRLPAMLAGVLCVPVGYLFAREFVGRLEAQLTALLIAVSYHHVWFSQSARGYTLLALFTLLSSWLFLRGMRRGRVSDFIWYGIVGALGAYTHLTMVFVVASHALLYVAPLVLRDVHLPGERRWKLALTGFALAAGLTVLLYSPFLLEVQRVVGKEPAYAASPRWAALELLKGLRIGLGSVVGVAIAGALFLVGLLSYYRQSRFLLGMFLLPGVVTLAATVVLQRPVRPRFFFFLIGFGLLIIVRGALEVGRVLQRRAASGPAPSNPIGVALALGMAIASAISLSVNYRFPKQDYEGPIRFVEARQQPGETVATAGGAKYPYREYYRRAWLNVDSLAQLDRARQAGHKVWMIYTLKSYIKARTPDLMRTIDEQCTDKQVFRGTVGDGDVTVCSLSAVPAARGT